MRINNTRIEVVREKLTDQDVDVIVNPATTALNGGSGIDGEVHRLAGPGLLQELIKVAPNGAKTGTAVVTKAYNLPGDFIIHTPGPVWCGGNKGEAELLERCYRSSIKAADQCDLETMAFPSISTGSYGYPLELAAPLAVKTLVNYLESHPNTRLLFVIFALENEDEYYEFVKAVEYYDPSMQFTSPFSRQQTPVLPVNPNSFPTPARKPAASSLVLGRISGLYKSITRR